MKDHYKFYEQEVLFLNHRLYVYVNASGILYASQENALNKDSLYFTRIDSTEHAGYNIECFSFIYQNDIYNFGGYGFWRWNGQLRKFIPRSREWDIVALNFEQPISKRMSQPVIWQNSLMGQIRILSYMRGNQASVTDPQKRVDSILNLDLATKKWESLGSLNPEIARAWENTSLIANLDSGVLVSNTGVIEYWNLLSNKVLKLKDTNYRLSLLQGRYRSCISWMEGNKLIVGDPLKADNIDSIFISPKDFEPTTIPIQMQFQRQESLNLGIDISFGLVVMILLVVGYYSFKKYKKIEQVDTFAVNGSVDAIQTSLDLNSSYPKQQLFTATESDLLKLIIKNAKERNRYTNVDEINRVLGVGNKSMDMQKRKRSDVIKNINERYALATNRNSIVLINRIKSEIDGRLYEFYIEDEELSTVLKHIQ